MRPLVLSGLVLVACSSTPGPVDSGTPDSGTDAGSPDAGRVCLDPDAGAPSDAGRDAGDGGDFSCTGAVIPQTAVPTFTVDGIVTSAGLVRRPVTSALVELFGATGNPLGTHVTPDGGTYSLSTDLSCLPLDGYLKASHRDAGFYDIYYYPPAPWRRPRAGLELVIFDDAARNLAAGLANVTIVNGTAALALGIDDCAGDPVSGATFTSTPAGDIRYVAASGLPSSMQMSTSSKGQVLIFNLPPGTVQVTATARGQTFPTKSIDARADAITSTTLTP